MFNNWPCSYWFSYMHYQHAPCDGYNPPQLPSLSRSCVQHNNCLPWVDRVCLSWGRHLSCPSTPPLSNHPLSLLKCHHVSTLVSWVWGPPACPFYAASLSHNRKFLRGQAIKKVRGGKKVVHVQFMAKSFYPLLVRLVTVAWFAVRCCATLRLSFPR